MARQQVAQTESKRVKACYGEDQYIEKYSKYTWEVKTYYTFMRVCAFVLSTAISITQTQMAQTELGRLPLHQPCSRICLISASTVCLCSLQHIIQVAQTELEHVRAGYEEDQYIVVSEIYTHTWVYISEVHNLHFGNVQRLCDDANCDTNHTHRWRRRNSNV